MANNHHHSDFVFVEKQNVDDRILMMNFDSTLFVDALLLIDDYGIFVLCMADDELFSMNYHDKLILIHSVLMVKNPNDYSLNQSQMNWVDLVA